jgi:hypothetical protein
MWTVLEAQGCIADNRSKGMVSQAADTGGGGMMDEREELRSMILADQLHQSEFKLRLRDAHIDSLKSELAIVKAETKRLHAELATTKAKLADTESALAIAEGDYQEEDER